MTHPKKQARFLSIVLTMATVALCAVAVSPAPAAAVSRSTIVLVAQGELNDSSRNHESPADSGCNFYTGYFRTWKPSDGCPSTDGVRWRDSDWCADFVKYVWSKAGVPHASIPEGTDGAITGWVCLPRARRAGVPRTPAIFRINEEIRLVHSTIYGIYSGA